MHNVSKKAIVKIGMNFKTYSSTQDSEQNTPDGINKMM